MKLIWYLVPDFVIEMLSSSVGYLVRIAKPSRELRVEGKIRGWFWGKRMGCKQLFVGRHVLLEGSSAYVCGSNVRFNHGVQVALGNGSFSIGDDSHLASQTTVSAAGGVEIGARCAISSHVSIYSTSNVPDGISDVSKNPVVFGRVQIGDGVFIGTSAVVLPNVTIGNRAVIAAGAIVTQNVPEGETWAGVPARPVGRTVI